jgi:GAF domain-containing protein
MSADYPCPVDRTDRTQAIAKARDFAEFAREQAAEPSYGNRLQSIVRLAVEAAACDMASITMRLTDGRIDTAASTDQVLYQADQWQYELSEGPCIDSIRDQESFVVEDIKADPRWPKWGPRAAELGLTSILSVRLFTDERTYGALNMYSSVVRDYDSEQVAMAKIVGAHASAALATARKEQDVWAAVDSRHLIGQAQGILMERFSLDAEQAFSVLRRYSQHHNRKLREVARELVETRELPPASNGASPNSVG